MIVSCPVCATNYQVDDRALGAGGRMVRCAQCSHTWRQMPPAEEPAPETESVTRPSLPPEPAPEIPARVGAAVDESPQLRADLAQEEEEEAEAEAEEEREARRRRGSPMVVIGWLLLLLVIAGFVGGGIWQRKEVIALWPASLRLYEALGLETVQPSDGLVIHVNPRRDEQNGVPRLVIEGEVINSATVALPVPQLKVELKDTSEHVVQTWTFAASADRLLPGASVPFTTSVERPNEAATSMSVSFVDEEHQ